MTPNHNVFDLEDRTNYRAVEEELDRAQRWFEYTTNELKRETQLLNQRVGSMVSNGVQPLPQHVAAYHEAYKAVMECAHRLQDAIPNLRTARLGSRSETIAF